MNITFYFTYLFFFFLSSDELHYRIQIIFNLDY